MMTERGSRRDPASRRVIDVAVGIVMGLRGCSERDAFGEFVAAVHDTGVGPGTLARALVGLVGGSEAPLPHREEAAARWGHLIANRVASMHRTAD